MRNQLGFSLIEIITTLTILSLTSAFAYPSVDSWRSKMGTNRETTALANLLNLSKYEAIRSNSYAVVCFTDSGYFAFVDNGANGGKAGDWIRQVGEKELDNHKLSGNLTLTTNFSKDRMRFRGRIGNKMGTVWIMRNDKKLTEVIVNLVGRVRTQKCKLE